MYNDLGEPGFSALGKKRELFGADAVGECSIGYSGPSWSHAALGGDQGVAERVNLAINFCWIRDSASDLLA